MQDLSPWKYLGRGQKSPKSIPSLKPGQEYISICDSYQKLISVTSILSLQFHQAAICCIYCWCYLLVFLVPQRPSSWIVTVVLFSDQLWVLTMQFQTCISRIQYHLLSLFAQPLAISLVPASPSLSNPSQWRLLNWPQPDMGRRTRHKGIRWIFTEVRVQVISKFTSNSLIL